MTPTQFAKTGEALYGPSWRGRMGQALMVADRTIRRWEQGDSAIPETVSLDLARLCQSHALTLGVAQTELHDQMLKKVEAHLKAVMSSLHTGRDQGGIAPHLTEANGIVGELIAFNARQRLWMKS